VVFFSYRTKRESPAGEQFWKFSPRESQFRALKLSLGSAGNLRQRPHYARKIWKRSFISTVKPTAHTNPSRKRSFFWKRSASWRDLKTPPFRFHVNGKHFENGDFRKQWRHDNHVIFLTVFSSKTNPKWPVIAAFLNSFGVVWTENIWCVFRVKLPFSNSSVVVWMGPYPPLPSPVSNVRQIQPASAWGKVKRLPKKWK